MEDYLGKDRRKEKRVKEENRVTLSLTTTRDPQKTAGFTAFTEDISLGGAKILTDKFFPVDTELTIGLHLPESGQVIKIYSRVRSIQSAYDGLYKIGVQFLHDIPAGVLALLKHIHGHNPRFP